VIVHDLPLLDLFTRLCEADLPLSIDDYHLLLQALQGGFGIANQDALRRLCRVLWVKSDDDSHVFDYHFEQIMAPAMEGDLSSEIESPSLSSRRPARFIKSFSTPTSEPMLQIEDDIQVAKVMSQETGKDETAYSQFIQTDEYLPVTRRQMKQSWRYLRRSVREGPPVELDVDATIMAISRQGFMLDPVLVPRRMNRAELLLLIDQGGSMAPFHVLSRRLAETALRGGRLGSAGTYYFHNCPVEYLYHDFAHHKAESVKSILSNHHEQTGILVFSDGGAARGGFNLERYELTEKFLEQFRQKFRHIAWLNPVPKERWLATTAAEIMQLVPMFDIRRRGLDTAISVLRGLSPKLMHTLRQSYYE
jgi:uncharacterized protein with von Willebrand factor type A (vWA) domain